MATKIEWVRNADGELGETWNPIRARNKETGGVGHYCEKVSTGCSACYAERMQPRFKNHIRYNAADRDKVELFLDQDVLRKPLRWRKQRMIFVCSMTDLFGDWVPDEWIDQVFAVMALTPQHTYQCLTKRPERMAEYLAGIQTRRRGYWHEEPGLLCAALPHDDDGLVEPYLSAWHAMRKHYYPDCVPAQSLGNSSLACPWPLPNVWLGCSVENQQQANARIPRLLRCPAAVRWLSCEPLLEDIDLRDVPGLIETVNPGSYSRVSDTWLGYQYTFGVDWCVVGGESGPNARPFRLEWARSLLRQCKAAGVPYFLKQVGSRPFVDAIPQSMQFLSESYRFEHGRHRLLTEDPKGGDIAEFPEDLQVREMPNSKGGA